MGQYERYSPVRYLHTNERGNVMKDVIVDRHFKFCIFMLGYSIMTKQSVLYSPDIDYTIAADMCDYNLLYNAVFYM